MPAVSAGAAAAAVAAANVAVIAAAGAYRNHGASHVPPEVSAIVGLVLLAGIVMVLLVVLVVTVKEKIEDALIRRRIRGRRHVGSHRHRSPEVDLVKILGWPRCDRCDKPVDRVESHRDIRTMEDVFVVHCHGQTECTRLADFDIMNADEIRFDTAFRRPMEIAHAAE